MTGRDVLRQALMLMDRIDESGDIDTSNTADYERKTAVLLNQYITELARAERRETVGAVHSLEEEIPLEQDTINQCLVYAIAFHLAFMDHDISTYNLYQAMYERNKGMISLSEETVTDELNMTGGMV